jgi:AraC-like DNA-binding protein
MHDVWTLFIVDRGAIRYDLDRHERGADPPMVSLLPPHVVHDGRPADENGFRKRVLYLETSLLPEHVIGPAVDRPVIGDHGLRREVAAVHDALSCADDLLEAETRLAFVVERIRRWLGGPVPAREASDPESAERLRAYLDRNLFRPVTIGAAASELGVGTAHLARTFARSFGIAPHAYLVGRRLEAARDRILRGQPIADVAVEVGFVDQAHLTRHFRRYLGTTPGRFRAS